jgi:hypothetical protein
MDVWGRSEGSRRSASIIWTMQAVAGVEARGHSVGRVQAQQDRGGTDLRSRRTERRTGAAGYSHLRTEPKAVCEPEGWSDCLSLQESETR